MGLGRFELPTPRLSSVCSDQLSYRPLHLPSGHRRSSPGRHGNRFLQNRTGRVCLAATKLRLPRPNARGNLRPGTKPGAAEYQIDLECPNTGRRNAAGSGNNSRKEVIQPQVLLQLPCYDFTPITNHTLGACLPCGLARRLLVQPAFVM